MEFFDDITIPYEYLQQPSKLYPLKIISIGISYYQLYEACHKCHQIILSEGFSSFLEWQRQFIELPCDSKRTYTYTVPTILSSSMGIIITNSQHGQLSDGFIAQLVEHCKG